MDVAPIFQRPGNIKQTFAHASACMYSGAVCLSVSLLVCLYAFGRQKERPTQEDTRALGETAVLLRRIAAAWPEGTLVQAQQQNQGFLGL